MTGAQVPTDNRSRSYRPYLVGLWLVSVILFVSNTVECRSPARRIQMLKSNDPTDRSQAALFYGRYPTQADAPELERALPELIRLLADSDSQVRADATYGLGRVAWNRRLPPDTSTPTAVQNALLAAANDSSPRVRQGAVDALGELCVQYKCDDNVLPTIRSKIRDVDRVVRIYTIVSLGWLAKADDAETIQGLEERAANGDKYETKAAATALRQIRGTERMPWQR